MRGLQGRVLGDKYTPYLRPRVHPFTTGTHTTTTSQTNMHVSICIYMDTYILVYSNTVYTVNA